MASKFELKPKFNAELKFALSAEVKIKLALGLEVGLELGPFEQTSGEKHSSGITPVITGPVQ